MSGSAILVSLLFVVGVWIACAVSIYMFFVRMRDAMNSRDTDAAAKKKRQPDPTPPPPPPKW